MDLFGEEISQEEFAAGIAETQENIKPVMMMILGMIKFFADSQEYADMNAQMTKNLFEAYRAQGFTVDQALN